MTIVQLRPTPTSQEEIAELLALHPLPMIAGQRECPVCGRLFNPMGIAPHLDKHRREAGLLAPRPRPGAGPRKRGARRDQGKLTRTMILDVLREAGEPIRCGDVADRLGLTDRLERKSVANRLGVLTNEGKVRKVGVPRSHNVAYELMPRRGRPEVLPAVREAAAPRAAMAVEDACTGLLLGMTGKESVPLAQLPEIVRWMGATAQLLDHLT